MPDKEPELGEYRAIRAVNNMTGEVRWVVCYWGRNLVEKPCWVRTESYTSRRKARDVAAMRNAANAWVLDA